jgi:hypothetical protein
MMLSRILVAMGKYKVKFFLCTTISPGNFPKNAIPLFLKNNNIAPNAAMVTPIIINSFAILFKMSDIIIKYLNYKFQVPIIKRFVF